MLSYIDKFFETFGVTLIIFYKIDQHNLKVVFI